jgi:hypothetical protein
LSLFQAHSRAVASPVAMVSAASGGAMRSRNGTGPQELHEKMKNIGTGALCGSIRAGQASADH